MVRKMTLLVPFVLFISACGGGTQDTPADSTAVPKATPAGEATGMSTPESVIHDEQLNVWFVSNINGNPSQKDNNGFIARVHADSLNVVTRLAEGGKNNVTLNAPKGLAIVGDTLWVTDIDAMRGFDKRTGAPLATIEMGANGALFLNDVAASPDGSIFITDSGLIFDSTGAMTHPGPDRIFKVAGRTVSEVTTGAALSGPNGIAWDATGNRWIIGPFSSNDLLSMSAGSSTPTKIATGPGSYDGIVVMGHGKILVSSWADSAVHMLLDSTFVKIISGVNAPADIGFDERRMIIAIPMFMEGKVSFYRIGT